MKKIISERKLCLICMEEHDVDKVEVIEYEIFKDQEVTFTADYEYCPVTDEYLETEDMIRSNSLAMKDAYRRKVGLLTSEEIISIRQKYGVSQKDFSEILNWGGATIARYESHQVQSRVHDNVLRKLKEDPKWFLEMLKQAEGRISDRAYNKYYQLAKEQYSREQNKYLIDSIKAIYTRYEGEEETGGVALNLTKVVDMINYLATKVNNLHKVKLMKMLWYSDALHFKRYGKAISGLAYSALPMGAVPEGHEQIMLLEGVSFDTTFYGDKIAYRFYPVPGFEIKELNQSEIDTMDQVISGLGNLNTEEIINKMHEEEAYQCTGSNCVIPFSLAAKLALE
ncbi:MAG: type II TA system antitoxin MqsA family protein [Anaerovoracaceae bacterium]